MTALSRIIPKPTAILASQPLLVKPSAFIKMSEVNRRTMLSKSTIYKLIQQGQFPSQISICGRNIAFLESDIDQWIEQRVAAARGVNQ